MEPSQVISFYTPEIGHICHGMIYRSLDDVFDYVKRNFEGAELLVVVADKDMRQIFLGWEKEGNLKGA